MAADEAFFAGAEDVFLGGMAAGLWVWERELEVGDCSEVLNV